MTGLERVTCWVMFVVAGWYAVVAKDFTTAAFFMAYSVWFKIPFKPKESA
jgi:hypothetical protein